MIISISLKKEKTQHYKSYLELVSYQLRFRRKVLVNSKIEQEYADHFSNHNIFFSSRLFAEKVCLEPYN